MKSSRNPANPAEALDAEQLPAQQPSSSQNKRRQPLADGSSNNNNNGKNHDEQNKPHDPKLLNDNVDRLIQNLRRVKNEQVEAVLANWISEKNNTQNIYASAMVKIPRNIKAMTLAEFNAVYKTDLLATLLQRQQPEPQQQQQQPCDDDDAADDADEQALDLDPMEQTLQMGTVLKGGRQHHAKKPAAAAKTTAAVTAPQLKLAPVAVAAAAAAASGSTARPIGPAVAAAAASFQHGAAATTAVGMKRQPMTTPSTKRPPVTTPSGRQARHGEVLFSKNGSPVEAGPARGVFENHDGDTYIVATVTKKKRRPSGGAAQKQGQEGEEEEESVMAFGIDVGGGEYISLQDATVATQLDPAKKNAALFQLQQLKEQVDTVMKNLQINNHGENSNNEI